VGASGCLKRQKYAFFKIHPKQLALPNRPAYSSPPFGMAGTTKAVFNRSKTQTVSKA
jgi:hypothetical protein